MYSTAIKQKSRPNQLSAGSIKLDQSSANAAEDTWSTTATQGAESDARDGSIPPDQPHSDSIFQEDKSSIERIQSWLKQLPSEEPWNPLKVKSNIAKPQSDYRSHANAESTRVTHGPDAWRHNGKVMEYSSVKGTDEFPYSIKRWLEQPPSEDVIGVLMLKRDGPQTLGCDILAGLDETAESHGKGTPDQA